MTDLKVTLIRSVAHRLPNQRKIVKALGLTKTNQVVEHNKTDIIMGMVNKIPHLVEIVK